ncbi:MAG: hypothetical protein AAF985_23145, partial [Bacteroidota bacterium]
MEFFKISLLSFCLLTGASTLDFHPSMQSSFEGSTVCTKLAIGDGLIVMEDDVMRVVSTAAQVTIESIKIYALSGQLIMN